MAGRRPRGSRYMNQEIPLDKLLDLIGEVVAKSTLGPMPERRQAYDIEKAAYLIATFESARYMVDKMRLALNVRDRDQLLRFALEKAPPEGLVLEFGVAGGRSLRYLGRLARDTVYGFDSFEGLPEDWTHFQRKGRFSRDGAPPRDLGDNVEIVKGWFEDTLPGFFDRHPGPLRLAHVDCDLYSSTQTVLKHLEPRLQPGSVLLFDEYLNYPGWQQGEHRAFQELVADTGLAYEYLGFHSIRGTVAVRITALGPAR